MTATIRVRLIGAFLVIAVLVVALVALFIQQADMTELRRVALARERKFLAADLTAFYRQERSWRDVRTHIDQVLGVRPGRPPEEGPRPGDQGAPVGYGLPAIVDADDEILLPIVGYPRGSIAPPEVLSQYGETIVVDGQKVGTVLLFPPRDRVGPEEQAYYDRTTRALWLGSFGGILVASMVGLFFAQKITAPLRGLTAAVRRIAGGDLEQRVPVSSRDEIGELASAFNQMSQDLALQVRLRQQMTADIAHDLRTPLTAIAGYVEAMRDGDLAPTPERLTLVATEIDHLQRMVGDLRLLSQADAGELRLNLSPVRPAVLLDRAAAAHQRQAEQHGVALRVDVRTSGVQVVVDEARIARVFDNLVDNAIRHTPSGGEVVLSATPAVNGVAFAVRDTGMGIPAEDLPHVFDRFYRADKARGDSGHSGLGLAIVRALVEAHGGRIHAASDPGHGTEFAATLPSRAD